MMSGPVACVLNWHASLRRGTAVKVKGRGWWIDAQLDVELAPLRSSFLILVHGALISESLHDVDDLQLSF